MIGYYNLLYYPFIYMFEHSISLRFEIQKISFTYTIMQFVFE